MGNIVSVFAPGYIVKNNSTYQIVTDHLGSVRLVVNVVTGAIAQRIEYDEYGNVTKNTNPDFQPFGYVGGLYDEVTKLVRFGARDYDASVGRWTTKDPIDFDGGTTNLYEYVVNDPINSFDKEGLQGQKNNLNFGSGWTGRYDPVPGTSNYEVHVYNPQGGEAGIWGPKGWIGKHGLSTNPNVPKEVINKINGFNVQQLRARGILGSKGTQNIKGMKYLNKLPIIGWLLTTFEAYELQKRAEANGVDIWTQWLIDNGYMDPPNCSNI